MAGPRQPAPARSHRRPAVARSIRVRRVGWIPLGGADRGRRATLGHARRWADLAARRHRTGRRGRQRDRTRCLGVGAHLPGNCAAGPADHLRAFRGGVARRGTHLARWPRRCAGRRVGPRVRISAPGAGPDQRRTRLRADRIVRRRRSDHLAHLAALLHRRRRGDVELPARALHRGLRPRSGGGSVEHRRPVASLRGAGHRRLAVEAALPLERRRCDLAAQSFGVRIGHTGAVQRPARSAASGRVRGTVHDRAPQLGRPDPDDRVALSVASGPAQDFGRRVVMGAGPESRLGRRRQRRGRQRHVPRARRRVGSASTASGCGTPTTE